jgi:hypothetical protein
MAVISFIACIIGIIYYFSMPIVTVICGAISILNSIIQLFRGAQNNLGTEIFIFIIGVIIALVFKLPFLATVGFVFCIGEVLLALIGIILMLIMNR